MSQKETNSGGLLARARSKIERTPVPRERLRRTTETGLLAERRFREEMKREVSRVAAGGTPGHLAYLYLAELPALRDRFGARIEAQIAKQMTALVRSDAGPLTIIGRDLDGRFTLLLSETTPDDVIQHLVRFLQHIVSHEFVVHRARLRLTPVIGYTPFAPSVTARQLRKHALLALSDAITHLDLEPVVYKPELDAVVAPIRQLNRWTRLLRRLRLPMQLALVASIAFLAPFLLYLTLDVAGLDVAGVAYLVIVVALLITGIMILVEGIYAVRREDPPTELSGPYPAASAIIAADLRNEAATVVETIKAFLHGVEYPGPLQVILAYNTPYDLPIESVLREIARQDPRFVAMRIEDSTSKAQNVNAALAEVTGEFVGIFDADHHPQFDSFARAWRWLSHGSDVVQGHCLVRNGEESWVARLVAVEFEALYAVGHPGRARLYGFGIFGGTNGYWKTDLLRQTRMHGLMLTEDIDSSMRLLEAGYRITSDPHLISRELAPVALEALWNQRMRWAQGWFQVFLKHVWPGLRSPHLSPRQKLGVAYQLVWCEIYPWISVQMFPLIVYLTWRIGGLTRLDWLLPIFVLTSLFTLCTGPGKTLFAYRLAHDDIRRRKSWFVYYLLMSLVLYESFINIVTMVSQLKEVMHERRWKTTPRAAVKQS